MRAIVLSDTHLGYDKSESEAFRAFLDDLPCVNPDYFIICGDFMELWRRDITAPLLEYCDVLAKLKELNKQMEVVLIAGNHDWHFMRMGRNPELYPLPFRFKEVFSIHMGDFFYSFKHGHQYDPLCKYPRPNNSLCYTPEDMSRLGLVGLGSWLWGRGRKIQNSIPKLSRLRILDPGYIAKMPAALIDIIRSRAKADRHANEFLVHGHCYDKDTKVLTKDGFKFFQELTYGDKLATLNLKTFTLEYHNPIELIQYDYDGDMIHFKSQWIDLKVTPNHNVLAKNHGGYLKGKPGEKWRFWKAEELFNIAIKLKYPKIEFLKGGIKWKGEKIENFNIPQLHGRRGLKYNIASIAIIPFLKFMGWYLSEGSCWWRNGRGGCVEISNFKDNNLDEIAETVKECGYYPKYRSNRQGILIFSSQLTSYLKQFGHSEDKFIPNFIKELSPALLSTFFETLIKGDGGIDNIKTGLIDYKTKSRKLAEDTLEIALKLGYSCSIHKISNKKGKEKKEYWRVRISTKKTTSIRNTSTVKIEDYKGKVYCATVPNHTLFVQREGKCVWSGNSHQAMLDIDNMYADSGCWVDGQRNYLLIEDREVSLLNYE